jgi:cytochrome c biogenesis protein ResB
VALLVSWAVYSAVGAILVGGDPSRTAQVFDSPLFYVLSGFLALSTATCAWERTRFAIRNLRTRSASRAFIERLATSPPHVVPVIDRASVVSDVTTALSKHRIRTRREGDLLLGVRGRSGPVASAVFHWCLALLFVAIVFGQLTRADGVMDVVVGTSLPDVADSYAFMDAGPWHGAMSADSIGVSSLESSLVVEGLERGVTPYVEVRSLDGAQRAAGHVYANSPLRYGSTLIHRAGHGFLALVRIGSGQGAYRQVVRLDVDRADSTVVPFGMTVGDASGVPLADVEFDVDKDEADSLEAESLVVRYGAPGGRLQEGDVRTTVLRIGEAVEVGNGVVLVLEDVSAFARLNVVDDQSVMLIYGLFVLLAGSLGVAIFVSPFSIWVLLAEDDEGCATLKIVTRAGKGDLGVADRVLRSIREHCDRSVAS